MPTQSLDLTGSLATFWENLLPENVSSLANATGSSVIDRTIESIISLPPLLLFHTSGSGAEAGSTIGTP